VGEGNWWADWEILTQFPSPSIIWLFILYKLYRTIILHENKYVI